MEATFEMGEDLISSLIIQRFWTGRRRKKESKLEHG